MFSVGFGPAQPGDTCLVLRIECLLFIDLLMLSDRQATW